jgi:hypothetical protein
MAELIKQGKNRQKLARQEARQRSSANGNFLIPSTPKIDSMDQ